MDSQMNMFGSPELRVVPPISPEEPEESNLLKCYRHELQSIEYKTLEELFWGFNTLRAITFSYDVSFIERILNSFNYAEIILGGNFLIQKDANIRSVLVDVLTSSYMTGESIRKYPNLVEMLEKGDIEFRTPQSLIDHRKIYILEADDGRTRVIKASANMTRRAWGGSQIECYDFDDSRMSFNENMKDFNTAWGLCHSITMDVIYTKKSKDLINGNILLKDIKKTGDAIILQHTSDYTPPEVIKYAIDYSQVRENYEALTKGITAPKKGTMFKIEPETVRKIEKNDKQIHIKQKKEERVEKYPSLTMDLEEGRCFLNEKELDLHPSEEEVKSDINEILRIFSNFDEFVSKSNIRLKQEHFKLMNALFCSPYIAKIRCAAFLKGGSVSALPLFALITSETPNSGKTFMIRTTLKLMTGLDIRGTKATSTNKEGFRTASIAVQGVPFFVDEVNKKFFSYITDIIKNPEICEENQLENMPMIVMASNDITGPDETIRKRMLFFPVDGALPSNIDKAAFEGIGKAAMKRLGTGLYREYLRRMMEFVAVEIERMSDTDKPVDYYTDLLGISSEVIVSILQDYGYTIPLYIRKLSWDDDYDPDSIATGIIEEIAQFCTDNKKVCNYSKNKIIIELGSDKDSKQLLKSWKDSLPPEMSPGYQETAQFCKLTIDKKVFESMWGHKIGGLFHFWKG